MKIEPVVETTVYCSTDELEGIKNVLLAIKNSGDFITGTMREDGVWMGLSMSLDAARKMKKMREISDALDGVMHYHDVDRIIASNKVQFIAGKEAGK